MTRKAGEGSSRPKGGRYALRLDMLPTATRIKNLAQRAYRGKAHIETRSVHIENPEGIYIDKNPAESSAGNDLMLRIIMRPQGGRYALRLDIFALAKLKDLIETEAFL